MITARPHHVIRTLQRLASPASSRTSLLPLERFIHGTSKHRAPKQTDLLPDLSSPNSSSNASIHYQKRFLNLTSKAIFKKLDIVAPLSEDALQTISPIKGVPLSETIKFKYSLLHVACIYHMKFFCYGLEHPGSIVRGRAYEKKKKDEPLWIWHYGASAASKACMVITAKRKIAKALRRCLEVRGWDPTGKRLANDGVGDLRGTITLYAAHPTELKVKWTAKDIQDAVDAYMDVFIQEAMGTAWKPVRLEPPKEQKGLSQAEKQTASDWCAKTNTATTTEDEYRVGSRNTEQAAFITG